MYVKICKIFQIHLWTHRSEIGYSIKPAALGKSKKTLPEALLRIAVIVSPLLRSCLHHRLRVHAPAGGGLDGRNTNCMHVERREQAVHPYSFVYLSY